MSGEAMTVLWWMRPARRGDGMHHGQPTKNHVSIDGVKTRCNQPVPENATVVAVTPDWHKHATCYNCVYRLWGDHAPPGYVRPASGADFPLRRECPHFPGRGRDPLACGACTPPPAGTVPPIPRLALVPAGNPAPDVIRLWHEVNKYDHARCGLCGILLACGEEINIEFEAGTCHAACSDAPYPGSLPQAPAAGDRPRLPAWPPSGAALAGQGDPWPPHSARSLLDDFYGRLRSRSKHAWTAAVERGDAQAAELYRDILMDLAARIGAACDAMGAIRNARPGTEAVPADVLDPPPDWPPEPPADLPPGEPVLTFRPYPWEEEEDGAPADADSERHDPPGSNS